MIDIYVRYSRPTKCDFCESGIRTGQRVVTDGSHDFCSMNCEKWYHHPDDPYVHRSYGG